MKNKTPGKEFLSGFGFQIKRDYITACYSFWNYGTKPQKGGFFA
ncbi:MAG: hypothetical protein WCV67_04775 [Victivallaceae bacterium]